MRTKLPWATCLNRDARRSVPTQTAPRSGFSGCLLFRPSLDWWSWRALLRPVISPTWANRSQPSELGIAAAVVASANNNATLILTPTPIRCQILRPAIITPTPNTALSHTNANTNTSTKRYAQSYSVWCRHQYVITNSVLSHNITPTPITYETTRSVKLRANTNTKPNTAPGY